MKKLILSLSALLTLAFAKAGDVPTHMVIHFNDGSNVAFALDNKPSVTFGDNMSMSLDDGTGSNVADRAFSDLKSIELAVPQGSSASIPETAAGALTPMRDKVVLSGFAAGTTVAVYDLNGREMLRTATCGDTTVIDCSSFTAGVYMLKAADKSIKFLKH